MEKPLVVVTGARGRLARSIIPALKGAGFDVIPVSREKDDHYISYDELFFSDLMDRASAILHLAWSSVPKTSETNFGGEWLDDIPMLMRIISAVIAQRQSFRPPLQVAFFSSVSVYGETSGINIVESANLAPAGWYALSKIQAEEILRFAENRGYISTAILRVSNPYGFFDELLRPQGLIARIIESVKTGDELVVWGDGNKNKDYLYIEDLISAVILALEMKVSGTFNIGYGSPFSVLDVYEIVKKLSGCSASIKSIEDYSWDVGTGYISTDAFSTITGWAPAVSLLEGVERHLSASGIKK